MPKRKYVTAHSRNKNYSDKEGVKNFDDRASELSTEDVKSDFICRSTCYISHRSDIKWQNSDKKQTSNQTIKKHVRMVDHIYLEISIELLIAFTIQKQINVEETAHDFSHEFIPSHINNRKSIYL